MKEFITGERYC
jgi:hypothetical protein